MNTATMAVKQPRHTGLIIVLLAWFGLVVALGLNDFFVPPPGQPPINLLLMALLALGLFFTAYYTRPRFRDYVLNLDMRFLIMIHSWRTLGLGFIMLYLFDRLPALFALAAGLGDALVAIGAVFLAYALFQRPETVSRTWIWRWNTFGLLDFILAVSLGILTRSGSVLIQADAVNSDIMTQLPFIVIPGFLVQVFTLTHIIVFLQLNQSNTGSSVTHPATQA